MNADGCETLAMIGRAMSRSCQSGRKLPQHVTAKNVRKLIRKAVDAQRRGARDQAARLCGKVLAIESGNSDALHLLGLVEFENGRTGRAIQLIGEAIKANPASASYHSNLAAVHRTVQDDRAALEHARAALELDPGNRDALEHATLAALGAGEIGEALGTSVHLLRIDPRDSLAREWLKTALMRFPDDEYSQPVCELLRACYTAGLLNPRALALPAARQLMLRYGIKSGYSSAAEFRLPTGIARDPLFLDFLANGFNCVPEMELFLTDLRSALLQSVSSTGSVDGTHVPLLAAMCAQCFNNEYVFATRGAENDLLKRLLQCYVKCMESPDVNWREVEVLLLVLGMFMPVNELPRADEVAARPLTEWQFCVQFVLQRQLFERLEETELREQIPRVSAVENRVSKVVQTTYERYPYPRWTYLPNVRRLNYSDWLRSCYPHCDALPDADKLDVLVAGCGTGKHPITLATHFDGLDITAIDLSATSLAYAQRMANLHGATNVRFLLCDLLDVAALGRKFDLIESVGVLHHMEDPAEGLRALLCALKPGGILKLGLYSKLARDDVNEVRKLLPSTLGVSDDDIRALRYSLLCGSQTGERSSLCGIRDFYTLHECRDLLFHPQEHQFTMETLAALLSELDLAFLGFELDEHQRLSYAERFPHDERQTNLDNWRIVEQESPRLFRGMYQFYVIPRADGAVERAA